MNLTVPAIVFIVTNLWGFFAGIPFTSIQPSRPLLDRAFGSLQLASTAYTLEWIQPYLTPTRVALIPGATKNITAQKTRQDPDGIRRMNVTAQPVSKVPAAMRASREESSSPTGWPVISNAVDVPSLLSIWSTSFHEWLALLSEWLATLFAEPPRPQEPQDTTQENLVLILLVVILSIVVKQTFQHQDSVRETAVLRGEVSHVMTGLEQLKEAMAKLGMFMDGYSQLMDLRQQQQQNDLEKARGHIDRIERGIKRLLRLEDGLPDLRKDLKSANREFRIARDSLEVAIKTVTDALQSAVNGVQDVQAGLGHELQDLRENMDLMTDVRWALIESLLQYPSDLCNQLAMAVATIVSQHLNGPTTTGTTNATSSSSSSSEVVEDQ